MSAAALGAEWLKLRRSRLAWITFALVGLGCPALTAAFLRAATTGPVDTPLAIKVNAMLIGEGWTAYLGLLAQILSVSALLGAGVVVSWSFGREFIDQTLTALFASPTPLTMIVTAKFIVVTAWSAAVILVALAAAVALAPVAGLALAFDSEASAWGKVVVVGLSGGVLALPLAFVATAARGYLPAVSALILIVVVTQIVTVVGVGAWFPYASPSLWAGMGGQAAAALIQPVHLALIPATGAAGVAATLLRWSRMQVI